MIEVLIVKKNKKKSTVRKDYNFWVSPFHPDIFELVWKLTMGGYQIIVKKNCFKLRFEFDFLTAFCFSNYQV